MSENEEKLNPIYKSETGIDRWLRENIYTKIEYKGIFVEVGAATPELISNSYHFRKNGWRVIPIEPNPIFATQFLNKGYEVWNYACSNYEQDDVLFTIASKENIQKVIKFDKNGVTFTEEDIIDVENDISFHSFSHLSDSKWDNMADNYQRAYEDIKKTEIKVCVRKLDTILENTNINEIDILCIDVEGGEEKVLQGFTVEKWKPNIVIIENIDSKYNYDAYLPKYKKILRTHYDDVYIRFDINQESEVKPKKRVYKKTKK
jgi:FkbM family methyltransferase